MTHNLKCCNLGRSIVIYHSYRALVKSDYLKSINFRGYKFSRISRFFGKSAKCFVGYKKYARSPWGRATSQKQTSIDLISFSCLNRIKMVAHLTEKHFFRNAKTRYF